MIVSRCIATVLFAFALVSVACGRPAATPTAASSAATQIRLVAVDVFDTDTSTIERVIQRHGKALHAMLQRGDAADADQLAAEIMADGEYAYVKPALVTYYEKQASYLTIDIVDRRDAQRRMPFRTPPQGSHGDPGGLIVAWHAYEAKVFDLLRRGQLLPSPKTCPTFHCFGDPSQPELRPFSVALTSAADHLDELALVLRDNEDSGDRAAAAFLLAYVNDGNAVVGHLLPALHDESSLVRNNALRVLAEIALHHPEIEIPLPPIVEALSFPATTDRNKAAAILLRMLERPDGARLRRPIARTCGGVLLIMLGLFQPNNHDYAYMILKAISGKQYGERDYAAWRAWMGRVTKDEPTAH